MKKYILALSILSFCVGCDKTISCSDPEIEAVFVSYALVDIDTFVLRRFKADNNFQELIDTINVINNVSASYITTNDTTCISYHNPSNKIKPGFDWQIFIPATNRTISISSINREKTTGKCAALASDCFCNNKIRNIKIDNQVMDFNSRSYYNVFITK